MVKPHRVLVTGATGFVGRRLLSPLTEMGFEVHTACRRPAANHETAHSLDLFDTGAVDALIGREI